MDQMQNQQPPNRSGNDNRNRNRNRNPNRLYNRSLLDDYIPREQEISNNGNVTFVPHLATYQHGMNEWHAVFRANDDFIKKQVQISHQNKVSVPDMTQQIFNEYQDAAVVLQEAQQLRANQEALDENQRRSRQAQNQNWRNAPNARHVRNSQINLQNGRPLQLHTEAKEEKEEKNNDATQIVHQNNLPQLNILFYCFLSHCTLTFKMSNCSLISTCDPFFFFLLLLLL